MSALGELLWRVAVAIYPLVCSIPRMLCHLHMTSNVDMCSN